MRTWLFLLPTAGLGLSGCNEDPSLPNITPSAYADAARTRPMQSIDVDVLANDADPDGGIASLSIELMGQPANATALVSAGRVRVTPGPGFLGRVTFEYRARDAQGAASAPATVTVEVAAQARALLWTRPASQAYERWSVAGADGQWPVVTGSTACGMTLNAVYNASGTHAVIMTCGSDSLLRRLVVVRPREPAVAWREIVSDQQLHGNMVLSEDGSRVVVLRYEGDPNSPEGATNFHLLAIDTASGAIQRSMAIGGVELIHGITGGGPARTIYVQARDNSSGAAQPAILTADLDSGSLARLPLGNPYMVTIEDASPAENGGALVFHYEDQRLYALDSLRPGELQIPWEDPLSWLRPVAVIPGGADVVVSRYPLSYNPQEFWVMPLRNPAARRSVLLNGFAIGREVAVRPDGRRMLYTAAPTPSLHTFLFELSLADGARNGSIGPSGGILWLHEFEYLGAAGDVLVTTSENGTQYRLYIVRQDQRSVMIPVAGDVQYQGVIVNDADVDGTGIAFSVIPAGNTARFRAFLSDVNLPAVSVPLLVPATGDEDVYVFAAFPAPSR